MNKTVVSLHFGDWTAEIVPQFGMNAIGLDFGGEKILRRPENLDVLQNSPYLYGTPLLFPANRTQNGKFNFQGEEYVLPLNEPSRGNHLHGLMFDAPFEVVSKGDNRLEAEFVNCGERYPFPFKITVIDTLGEKGYQRELTVENIGEKAMPYTLAFHTAFLEKTSFSAPIKERYEPDSCFIPTGNMLPLTELEKECVKGTSSKGKTLSGSYTIASNRAEIGDFAYEFQNFDTLVLFNAGGGEGFLCIEPQAGAVNGLNSGKCEVLEAGESKTYVHRIFKK